MRLIAIWDLDNCLFNDAHRIPFIDWTKEDADERYEPYHDRISLDLPANHEVFHAITLAGYDHVFFTARPRSVEVATRLQIDTHLGIHDPRLFMRSVGDHRSSVQLKHHMLLRLKKENPDYRRIIAFDDREDVVAMYIQDGIEAMVLAAHESDAFTDPNTGITEGGASVAL